MYVGASNACHALKTRIEMENKEAGIFGDDSPKYVDQ